MRTILLNSILWLLCTAAGTAASGLSAEVQRTAFTVATTAFEELDRAPSLALVVMSMHNCVGCAMLAANNAVQAVQEHDPTMASAVLVHAESERDVATIRHRLSTPYVVADTDAGRFRTAGALGATLPALVVFDHGEPVAVFEDIQHTPPDLHRLKTAMRTGGVDYGRRTVLTASVAAEGATIAAVRTVPSPGRALEEPQERSVKYLMSPVMTSDGDRLYCINHLANCIETWDPATGRLLEPVHVPDTLKYFFRSDPTDTMWTMLEQQGYDIARFVSLSAVDDTVYALTMVMSGYTTGRIRENIDIPDADDKARGVYWEMRQVAAKIYDSAVQEIVVLPAEFSFVDLLADRSGAIGGNCFETAMPTEFTDSTTIVAMIGRGAAGTEMGSVRLWKQAVSPVQSLGSVAASPNGTLWYCDPLQQQVFVSKPDGTRQAIAPKEQLLRTGSMLVFDVPDGMNTLKTPSYPYLLEGMKGNDERVVLILSPTDTTTHSPRLAQVYSSDGAFLGAHALDMPALKGASMAWPVAVRNDDALVLARTPDNVWRLVSVPLTRQ